MTYKESEKMIGRPATGMVMVRLLPDKLTTDVAGFEMDLPNARKNQWGEVTQLGGPYVEFYPFFRRFMYELFRVHPAPFKVGDQVLLPRTDGRKFVIGEDVYMVFNQLDVKVWRRSGGTFRG